MMSTERGAFSVMALLQSPVADDLEAVALEADDLAGRRVAQQHDLAHAEIEQDLRADTVFNQALLTGALKLLIQFEPRGKRVGPCLADQHDNAAPFPADKLH